MSESPHPRAGKYVKTTTIQVTVETAELLNRLKRYLPEKRRVEGYDDVINRILNSFMDVYVDVISVNSRFAKSSGDEVIFQLGDKAPVYYSYRFGQFTQLERPPEMVSPKPKIEIRPLKVSNA